MREFVPPQTSSQQSLSDRGELSASLLRVNDEAERIQQLALLHQLDENRLSELSKLTAVGMPEQPRSDDFQREGQVALTGEGGSGGDECFRPLPGQQVESLRSLFLASRVKPLSV